MGEAKAGALVVLCVFDRFLPSITPLSSLSSYTCSFHGLGYAKTRQLLIRIDRSIIHYSQETLIVDCKQLVETHEAMLQLCLIL